MRGDGKFRIGLNETQLGMSLPYWVKVDTTQYKNIMKGADHYVIHY